MNQIKKSITTQITLEDDFNVPDINPDIDYTITDDSSIQMENIKVLEGRVLIMGHLDFKLLYVANENPPIVKMSGTIPIDETINAEGLADEDLVTVKYDLEDISIGVINSRKISVRAIITFNISSENIYDIETATDINEADTYFKKNTIDVIQIAESKKDIFRIRKEVELPSQSPEISEILWDITKLKNVNTKFGNNSLIISGEVSTCILYKSPGAGAISWFEDSIPFNGSLDLSGIDESMIPDIEISLPVKNILAKSDSDGEERIIEFDMVLDLNIKIYKEQTLSYLSDVYSTKVELNPVFNKVVYNNLITKNISKCKINDRLKLDSDKGHILQVCGNEGEVKATVSLDTLVLSAFETNIITDITVSPRNDEHLEAMPGLLGYRIKSGDTLFSIAKEYFTTTDDIIEINSLASENISPGEMLLLVKHPN